MQINIPEAEMQFSQLVDRALRGEEVVIMRDGEPLLRLVPVGCAGTRPIGVHAAPITEDEADESVRPVYDELELNESIERGAADIRAGRLVSHREVRERLVKKFAP